MTFPPISNEFTPLALSVQRSKHFFSLLYWNDGVQVSMNNHERSLNPVRVEYRAVLKSPTHVLPRRVSRRHIFNLPHSEQIFMHSRLVSQLSAKRTIETQVVRGT